MAKTKDRKKTSVNPPLPQAVQTPTHIPAIIRALADNPFKNNEVEVVVPVRIKKSPLRASMIAPFKSTPNGDLGTLRVLPLEVLHMICLSLDLRSCFTLRQVNRRARRIVSGLPQYHDLANYALECLKVVFRSRVARMVDMDDLYKTFCSHECMMCSGDASSSSGSRTLPQGDDSGTKDAPSSDVACARDSDGKKPSSSDPPQSSKTGKVSKETNPLPAHDAAAANNQLQLISATGAKTDGMFLFLPTMTRCCRACLEESPRARAAPFCALLLASGLDAKDFASVRVAAPLLKPIKSAISENQRKILTGTVSQRDAAQVLLNNGKPPSAVKDILYQSGYIQEFSWPENLYERGAFTTIMPFMDRRAQKAFRGFLCKGCEQAAEQKYGHLKARLQYFKPVYGTQARFLDHVSKCQGAIRLWGAANTHDAAAAAAPPA